MKNRKIELFWTLWLPFFFQHQHHTPIFLGSPRFFWPPPTLLLAFTEGLPGLGLLDTPRRLVCFGCFFLFVYSAAPRFPPGLSAPLPFPDSLQE